MNVERLRLALIASGQAESYAFSKRWAERIAAEYDRLARASRPVPHSELASAVGPSADRRAVDAGPSEASEVQAGRLVQVPVADIPPGGGRPDMGVGR